MSYAKAMKHFKNVRKHKITASRIRGNLLVYGITRDEKEVAELARALRGK